MRSMLRCDLSEEHDHVHMVGHNSKGVWYHVWKMIEWTLFVVETGERACLRSIWSRGVLTYESAPFLYLHHLQ